MNPPRWLALPAAFVALIVAFAASVEPAPSPYVSALNAVDPDIVHGDPELAVERGWEVCGSLRRGAGPAVEQLFTSPMHPGGFGTDASAQILAVIRTHLCPDVLP